MQYRYAEKEDLPDVYVMYLAGLAEMGEEYDEKDALDYVLFCWSQAPCILLLKDGNIIGFAGLKTTTPAYNKSTVHLSEYLFYIQPANRGLKSWRTLCKATQEVSDRFNIPFVGTHYLSGEVSNHLRLIKMAGAIPKAIVSVYGEK